MRTKDRGGGGGAGAAEPSLCRWSPGLGAAPAGSDACDQTQVHGEVPDPRDSPAGKQPGGARLDLGLVGAECRDSCLTFLGSSWGAQPWASYPRSRLTFSGSFFPPFVTTAQPGLGLEDR